jgi:FixJ family two-component response regulator
MNGFDVQRELRLRGQKFPIIFITASEDEAVRAMAFNQGAAGFLYKPFSDTALLSAIEAALGDR